MWPAEGAVGRALRGLFWTPETVHFGYVSHEEEDQDHQLECVFCEFSSYYKVKFLQHLVRAHPNSVPDAINQDIVDGKTSCRGGPRVRVARVPGKRWRKTSEEDLSEDSDNESSTSVIGAPMDDQLQNEAFGEGDDQYILPPINSNDPPKSFFAVARSPPPTCDDKSAGFRVLNPVLKELCCLFCHYRAWTLGPMLKHLQTSHDFDSSRSPRKKTVSPPNKSVAEDPEPAVQNPSASPELNLHLSEDEDELNLSREEDINNDSDEVDVVVIDIKDRKKSSRIDQEGTGACPKSKPQIGSQEPDGNNNGQMAQTYSCPYCARIPLARKKIRKHICRHFKDYFASLALKSGKFLVCKDCLVKSLGNAEARPFVTGSEIGFARHMGLAHNRLDDTIIKCGDGGFWPRLVVILKKKINFDDLTLEETWESTSALHTKVAFGKVIANRMFRACVPVKRMPKKTTLKVQRVLKQNKIVHIKCPKITPDQIIRNAIKRRTKTKVTSKSVAIRPAPTLIVDTFTTTSLVIAQAGSVSSCKTNISEPPRELQSETFLTVPGLDSSTVYDGISTFKPLPISREISCSRWRSHRSSESGSAVKVKLYVKDPTDDIEPFERIVPFEEM